MPNAKSELRYPSWMHTAWEEAVRSFRAGGELTVWFETRNRAISSRARLYSLRKLKTGKAMPMEQDKLFLQQVEAASQAGADVADLPIHPENMLELKIKLLPEESGSRWRLVFAKWEDEAPTMESSADRPNGQGATPNRSMSPL